MLITIAVGALETVPKCLEKKTVDTGDQKKNCEYPEHSTTKIT